MSTTALSSLAFASQQVVIYAGTFLFIAGIIGGPLVLLVFLSLNTFRQSSCAFYLTVMSLVNTFHLFTGLLTFIMIYGFGINWIDMSLPFCKFRQFYLQSSIQISFTCMCLATIDQFLATCSNPRWHRWNNIKFARYIVIGVVIFWFLFEIPLLLNYNHAVSISGVSVCTITNTAFRTYFTFFHVLVLNSLPAIILTLFGILAYRNVQTIAYRTIPLVRRELDKQLTTMVLVHVFYDVVVITPQIIVYIFNSIVGTSGNLVSVMQQTSIQNFTAILFYFHFAVCINLH
jgi:hypothetical protein